MILILYIILALITALALVLAAVCLARAKLDFSIAPSGVEYHLRYLGFRLDYSGGKKSTRFLWLSFGGKSGEKAEKKKPKKGAGEKESEAEKEKEPDVEEVAASFWIRRYRLIMRVIAAAGRLVYRIITSPRLEDFRVRVIAGNGTPALSGSAYGWMYAASYWVPESVDFRPGFDFAPEAEWSYEISGRITDSIFRALIVPIVKALVELPLLDLFKTYRDYKKAAKPPRREVEKGTAAAPAG